MNIWNYNRFDDRKHKIIEFLRAENADIIALQEIRDDSRYNVEGHHQATQLNEALQYPHLVFVETMDLNHVDHTPLLPKRTEGLAVLSKYPIARSQKIDLSQHPDDKFTRQLLHCHVAVEQGIDIVVVHFSPHILYSELHLIEAIRLVTTKRIEPVILGDFNIYRPDIITQHAVAFHCSFDYAPYISYPSRQWTLDYVLIPKKWRFHEVRAEGDGISDHRAVIASIGLPR